MSASSSSPIVPPRAGGWLAPVATFVLSFAILFLLMPREVDLFDEGIVLVGAMRVLAGELPHRDVLTFYGPAPAYIVAGLWRLMADQFIAARLYGVAVEAGIVTAVFVLASRHAGRGLALLVALLGLRTMLADSMFLYPALPATLLALASAGVVARPGGADRAGALFLAGVLAGAVTLFRYESGVIVLVALGIVVAAPQLLVRGSSGAIRGSLWLGAGFAVVVLPLAAIYAAAGVGPGFRADIIDYSTRWYAKMRGLPLPLRHELLNNPSGFVGYYLPAGLALFAMPAIVDRLRALRVGGRTSWDGASPAVLVFAVLTAILVYKGLVRASMLHMVMATVASLPLAAVLANWWWRPGRRIAGREVGPPLAAAMLAATIVPTLPTASRKAARLVTAPETVEAGALAGLPDGVASRCPIRPELGPASAPPDQWLASRYLNRHGAPDERIFVGSARHDKLHKNSATIYFLAGRLPGTRWQQLDPGEITRADVQSRVIGELRRWNVRWIVKDATYEGFSEPNGSAVPSGVHLLDRFIDQVYRPVRRFGAVTLWLRRDTAAPASTPDDGCR